MKYLTAIYWLLLTCCYMSAAVAMPEFDDPKLRRVSSEEGLSQSTVNALLEDDQGFLWIGTEGGLNRFDGYNIRQINNTEINIAESIIQSLTKGPSGTIWIGTMSKGLLEFDPKSGQLQQHLLRYSPEDEEVPQGIVDVIAESSHKLWVATDYEVLLYDPRQGSYEIVFTLPRDLRLGRNIIRAIQPLNEYLLVGSSEGLFIVDTKTNSFTQMAFLENPEQWVDSRNVKAFYLDKSGGLWIGAVGGLFHLTAEQLKQHLELAKDAPFAGKKVIRNIWQILPDDNNLLLATDIGLFRYDVAKETATHLLQLKDSHYPVSDDDIKKMLWDSQGNLWLASKADGVFMWSPISANFVNLHINSRPNRRLSQDTVWKLRCDKDGKLWIGTQNGLNLYDVATDNVTQYLVKGQEDGNYEEYGVNGLLHAGEGYLWLVADTGLKLFNKATGEVSEPLAATPDVQNILKGYLYGVIKDDEGNLWFAHARGFFRYEVKSGELVSIDVLNSALSTALSNGFIGFLPTDPDSLLVGMAGEMWAYNTKQQQVKRIHQVEGAQGQYNMTPEPPLLDDHGILWVAYSTLGLYGLDVKTLETRFFFDRGNLLPSNYIYGLQLDGLGNMWMSSHAGLLRMDLETHHFQRFTDKDGLATNEFNSMSYARLADGRFAYGSMKGVTIFDPASLLDKELRKPKAVITEVEVSTKPNGMPFGNIENTEILLDHDDVGLTIKFSTLQYGMLAQTQYRYQFMGKSNISFPPSTRNEVAVPKLNPGLYHFEVTATDPISGLQSEPARLDIRVKYAPWNSPLAYTFYGFMVLSLAWLWRHKKRQQEEELLEAHIELKTSERRLQLALRGGNSGIWDWQADSNNMYQPRLKDELGYGDQEKINFDDFIARIHPLDRTAFEADWSRFISGQQESLDVSYRLKGQDDAWNWYRDLGRVVDRDQDGQILAVSGTFTNITQNRVSEEKARLFGEAFRHTRDWVLIFNADALPIAANQACCESLGLDPEQELPAQLRRRFTKDAIEAYQEKMMALNPGEHWRGEEEVLGNDSRLHHLMIKINAVANEQNAIDYFIAVMTDISEQKAAQRVLKQMANYDSLTGLPNRNLLLDRIQHGIEHATRRRTKLAVFFIDLDKFKQVNDTLGHDAGDQLLLDVASRLKSALRVDDTVGRLGGDEFLVVIEDFVDELDLSALAAKIISEVDQPIQIGNNQVGVSASVGIAVYPDDADEASDLLKFADIAMYHAKGGGRNRYQYFTEAMNQQALAKVGMENRLKQALKRNEFVNYYQPIIDLDSGQTLGFELLLRWFPDGKFVSPGEFIPLAEELGLIVPLTWQAMERAAEDLAAWHTAGWSPFLSVNISARHFELGISVEEITSILHRHRLPPSALKLEITEGALMHDHESARQCMESLYESGLRFALDDFGTGYSSLKYLKAFPIDIIKIDQSFVHDIGIDKNDEAIIITMMLMARSLGMECVAEGIETAEQARFLLDQGCSKQQGYLYSRPAPAGDVRSLLECDWREIINNQLERQSG
ncbi:EAL domain-containing protein [Aliiglaciecola sp. CAU 1673]|uniref:EAL domain-containing protein n=1 Tax=Aliiglaciecola sp. CAU 1673 TaxID=3032595 RepID=UPI0023DA5C98|nr:EAL domain-containing protein [Aliiglaciecola sp. CAU 1673]MDF2177892.1 EAL domain-containing protein [Aliiglaciecola sp. CAU 1673]